MENPDGILRIQKEECVPRIHFEFFDEYMYPVTSQNKESLSNAHLRCALRCRLQCIETLFLGEYSQVFVTFFFTVFRLYFA